MASLADNPTRVETTFDTADVSKNGLLYSDPRRENGIHEKYSGLKITWLYQGTKNEKRGRFKPSVYNRALGLTPSEESGDLQRFRQFKGMSHKKRKPAMNMVGELFTPDEASQLMQFLSQVWSGDAEHQKIDPDFPFNKSGASHSRVLAASRGHDSSVNGYALWELDGYDLPFKVEGYYNLSDHEVV